MARIMMNGPQRVMRPLMLLTASGALSPPNRFATPPGRWTIDGRPAITDRPRPDRARCPLPAV